MQQSIENYTVYNDRMRRSMWDKAFFMDKVPGASAVIDYGCADGSLIGFLSELFPSMQYIGYDIDAGMIALAREKNIRGVVFSDSLRDVSCILNRKQCPAAETAVNFSSVFHEVFHYRADTAEITRFLHQTAPRYLVVRDMMYSAAVPDAMAPAEVLQKVRQKLPSWQIDSFEKAHGPISVFKNLIHLLLKFRYLENWERECRENYFSYGFDDLLRVLDPSGEYRTIYRCAYFLPWCRYDAEETFKIDLGDSFTTHFALIMEKKTAHRFQ